MLSDFPPDIIFNIIYFLPNIHIINTLTQANQYLYSIIDNSYYTQWGNKFYGKDFWYRAQQRTPAISKPLGCMKQELMRLDNFNNSLKAANKVWTNKDYYNFWDMLEAVHKNSKTKNDKKFATKVNNISIRQ
jgi:hypothetical protein